MGATFYQKTFALALTDVKVLMIYRDRERNVQGTLAVLVAAHA